MNTSNGNGRVTSTTKYGPITVDKVFTGNFQKAGTLSAQIRQEVTTTSLYPSKQGTKASDDALFSNADFGFTEMPYSSTEKRVHWLNIPLGKTVADVEAELAAHPKARLVKTLSNRPIINSDQQYAINTGSATLDTFADTQVVRYPEGTVQQGVDVSGQIVLDKNGKVQYRAISFSTTDKPDVDLRDDNPENEYMSAAIKAELLGASVVEGQTI